MTDNLSKVLPTIKSRCQVLSFKNKKDEDINKIDNLFNFYLEKINNSDSSQDEFNTLLNNMISFINQIEKLKIKEYIHFKDSIFDVFLNKEYFLILFDFMLYIYYDILNYKLSRNIVYTLNYIDDIKKISENNSIEEIINKLNLIDDLKVKLDTNMNLKMLMDEFIIKFSEV